MREIKLKPCPFCGGEASITLYDPYDGYQGANCAYDVACCSKCSVEMQNSKKRNLLRNGTGEQTMKKITIEIDERYGQILAFTGTGTSFLGGLNVTIWAVDMDKTNKVIVDNNGKATMLWENEDEQAD